MNIRIIGQTSDALNEVVNSRLVAALNQHEAWVERVEVRLTDENADRGGVDKNCRVDVFVKGSSEVFIEERGTDPYAVVSLAADRVKQAVGRKVAKAREHQK